MELRNFEPSIWSAVSYKKFECNHLNENHASSDTDMNASFGGPHFCYSSRDRANIRYLVKMTLFQDIHFSILIYSLFAIPQS